MISKKIMLLAPSVVLGAMVMAADTPAPAASRVPGAETLENVGRQKKFFDISEMVRKANALMSDSKYDEAIKLFRQAKKELEPFAGGSRFKDKIEFCVKRIEQCYYKKAEDAMDRADDLVSVSAFDDAIKLCQEALKYCPELKDDLQRKISFYQKRREAAVARDDNSMSKLKPEFHQNEYNIQLLIEQGIVLLKRQEIMAARKKFEEVLLLDPYNETAIQNLLGVNSRLRKDAKIRANATARHLVGEVEWSGAIPIARDFQIEEAQDPDKKDDKVIKKEPANPMYARLAAIKLPKYEIPKDYLTFVEVMEELKSLAKENDPNKVGVNFVVRDAKHKSAKSAPKLAGYNVPRKVSLLEILNKLQERKDLTFKVDAGAVIVAAKGVPLEKMTVRTFAFPIDPTLTKDKLKNALTAAGVTFGPGADLELVPLRNEIVSKNTPMNQDLIENWTASRGADAKNEMVQIMFKFLEVAQNDLDELGFSWAYSRRGTTGSFDLGSNSLLRHYANDDANDRFGGAPVSSNINLNAEQMNQRGDGDSTYGFVWNDRKNSLAASVYALDWADSSDILYSPRVTTLNNTTARVDMTEKRYFPGEYEDIDSESTENVRVYVTNPQPTLDDERDLGIKFTIKPEIQPNDLIRAAVKFDIKQFDSWLIVDSRNLANEDDDGEYQKKAVINTRAITTDVVLKDGATVLIGSISQDLTTTLHDRIPILADIPLIGRLFQSRYTVSKKNNLLVFMTCKIIGPDGAAARRKNSGAPKNTAGERGLPKFPRNI